MESVKLVNPGNCRFSRTLNGFRHHYYVECVFCTYCFIKLVRMQTLLILLLCVISRSPCCQIWSHTKSVGEYEYWIHLKKCNYQLFFYSAEYYKNTPWIRLKIEIVCWLLTQFTDKMLITAKFLLNFILFFIHVYFVSELICER